MMKKIKFINRERELSFLEDQFQRPGHSLIVIYGRRRVGKTELLTRFQRDQPHIYYLCDARGTVMNAAALAKLAAEHFDDLVPRVEHFDDVFRYIVKRRKGGRKLVIVLDEFPYLVERDNAVLSVFQKIVDEVIADEDIMLVLCGSSMAMMYESSLSARSPLYGRTTGSWDVRPLTFLDALRFFPDVSLERAVEFHALFGGMPAFLSRVDPAADIRENITDVIMTKGSTLYRAPELLLRQETRAADVYRSILEAMATTTKLSEIASKSGLRANDMPKYLRVLTDLNLVRRETPVTEQRSRRTRYLIDDNLYRFWYTCCSPNQSYLEDGRVEHVYRTYIEKELPRIVSDCWEVVAREIVPPALPFTPQRTGSWWGHVRDRKGVRVTTDIDVVSLDERSGSIGFLEVKWSDMDARSCGRVLGALREKATSVEWQRGRRKEVYGLVVRRVDEHVKQEFRDEGYVVLDLADVARLLA